MLTFQFAHQSYFKHFQIYVMAQPSILFSLTLIFLISIKSCDAKYRTSFFKTPNCSIYPDAEKCELNKTWTQERKK